MDAVVDYGQEAIVKFLINLPSDNIDYSSALANIEDYLSYLNWFIPFGQLYSIFQIWLGVIYSALTVLLIYRWVTGQYRR